MMMKMKIFLIFSVLLVVSLLECNGETFSVNATSAEHPGMCFYNDKVYAPGDFQIKNRCIRLVCSQNGWVSGHSCVPSNREECDRGPFVDIRTPFPDCCKRKYTCKNDDGSEYVVEDF